MGRGIGFGAERLGLFALKFPRLGALCLVALLILFGVSLTRLSFDDDMYRVFLSDSPLSQAQRAYEAAQSPPLTVALIHVTSPEPFDAEAMTTLRNLSLDLEFVNGVTAVASPFSLRWPPTEDFAAGTPVFGPGIGQAYSDDLRSFQALETGLPTFVNAAHTAMLINVSIDTDATTVAAALGDIQTEIDRTLPLDLVAHVTGEEVIGAEIVSALKNDLIALNLWGALIISLGAILFLRDLRMAFLAVAPALFGAIGVLALSVWLGFPVTVLSNVIPILLLVLGVANGVHLTAHLKAHGTLKSAIEMVGPACALTAITTAIAFASISLTGNAQLFEFAILGSLGTIFSFVVVIVTFVVFGRVIPLSGRPIPPISARFAVRLTQAATARPKVTVAAFALFLFGATAGFGLLNPWFPLYQNLPDDSPTLMTNDAIADDFGGVFQMVVETSGDWGETHDLVQALEAANPPHTVFSEVNFARWLGHPEMPPTSEELEMLPQGLVSLLHGGGSTSRVLVAMPEPMRSNETLEHFDEVYEVANASGATSVIGLPTVMRHEAVRLIEQLSFGLVVAALGATGIVAFAFRSARFVPILIIPNVLPLMITGASLHLWTQGQLTPTALLALTIAFGIAIDDTVHFLNRFSRSVANGEPPSLAVAVAAKSAGQVMVLTTFLLTVGLSVTLFSDFTPIRLFGGMMIVTLWAALLIDLLLLPSLLTWKRTANASG